MWTGTDEDYFRLYSATATAIKGVPQATRRRPGGPGNAARRDGEKLEPRRLFPKFLDHCRMSKSRSTSFPGTATRTTRWNRSAGPGVRELLDAAGFPKAESHLNEWNYLPDNDWKGMLATDAKARNAGTSASAVPKGRPSSLPP